MAYTTADADAVRAAILALGTGAQVVSVAYADRTISYRPAQLAELRSVLAMIDAELGAASATPRPRVSLASGSKGL